MGTSNFHLKVVAQEKKIHAVRLKSHLQIEVSLFHDALERRLAATASFTHPITPPIVEWRGRRS